MARQKQHDPLTELDDLQLQCRDLRHTWDQWGSWIEHIGRSRILHRLLGCRRGCGTLRWDTYNARTMERVNVRYRYDEAYLLTGREHAPSGDEVRKEVFRRANGNIPDSPPQEVRDVLGI